jgi:dihydrolipoamide dehydrogenase
LLIVGSGAIGIEFASFYRSLGAEVTVVEMLPRVLPSDDEEISELARKAFVRRGIAIHTGTRVERLVNNADSVTASLRKPDGDVEENTAERVILAISIAGNVEGLGSMRWGSKSSRAISLSTNGAATARPAFMPSAT